MASLLNPIVKNTFIHVSADVVDEPLADVVDEARRSRSLPPSTRFGSRAQANEFDRAGSSFQSSVDDAPSTEKTPSIGQSSIGTWVKSGAKKFFVPPMPMGTPPPIPDGKLADNFQSNSSAEDVSTEASEDDDSSDVGSSTSADASMEMKSNIGLQGSYLVFSNAWNPGARTLARLKAFPAYQIEQVVMTLKNLLATCPCLSSIEVSEHSSCLLIVVRIPPQQESSKEQLMAFAKESLVWATEQSLSVDILGSREDPFMAMPKGFAATLVVVPDKQNACWNMLRGGVCKYGDRCHWEHRSHQRKIYVKLVEASAPA